MDSFRVFIICAVWFMNIESNHCQTCLFGGIQRNNDLFWCANAKRFLGTFHKGGGARGFIGWADAWLAFPPEWLTIYDPRKVSNECLGKDHLSPGAGFYKR